MRIVLLVLGLLAGCEDERPNPPGRGVGRASSSTEASAAGQPATPPEAPGEGRGTPTASPRAEDPSPAPAERAGALPTAEGSEAGRDASPPSEPERNLGRELHAAVGDPTPCLPSDQEALPSRLTIAVRATLSLTGVVTRAEVRAPELSETARRCIRERVQEVRLPGPIPDAPRTAHTTLTLER